MAIDYFVDFTNGKVIVGMANNVFVAKIIGKISEKKINDIPPIQFNSQLIYALKGDV